MESKIIIVIPVYNRMELTRNCLLSLREQTMKNFRVIVVDDGSTDGTSKMLEEEFSEVVRLKGNGNLWWAGATNLGIKWGLEHFPDANYIVTLNNDTILFKNYLEVLNQEVCKYPNALIGSLALDYYNPNKVTDAGIHINWLTAKYTYPFNNLTIMEIEKSGNEIFSSSVLSGRGTVIPVKAINEIGLFNEAVFPQYAADYDLSLRAKKKGYELITSYNLRLYSFPKLTGIANSEDKIPLSKFCESLVSIRSANNIKKRFLFNISHVPSKYLLSYLLMDFGRVIFGTLIKRVHFKILAFFN